MPFPASDVNHNNAAAAVGARFTSPTRSTGQQQQQQPCLHEGWHWDLFGRRLSRDFDFD